jgi:predicted ATPase
MRAGIAIKGDPGIGKSTLVETRLQITLLDCNDVLIAKTHCLPNNEDWSYIPLFDAINQLCKNPDAEHVRNLLMQCAPSLSAQMPWLTHNNGDYSVSASTIKPEREKLLLEATEFIERLSQEKTFIWFIDDAHRCDNDTRDLLSYVLHREGDARLLILTTHCNWHGDSNDNTMPAASEAWVYRSKIKEIYLDCLDKTAITAYLKQRFSKSSLPTTLVDKVYDESNGHPLFAKGIVDRLLASKTKRHRNDTGYPRKSSDNPTITVPEVIRRRMDIEITILNSDEFRLLQAASIVVVDAFFAAAVATLLGQDIVDIEDQCDELARTNRWICRLNSRLWPDGTLAQLYGFSNPVYRDYLYQTLPAARRRQFHCKHAERLEDAYGDDVTFISKNLVYHSELGGNPKRVVQYKQLMQHNNELSDCRFHGLQPQYHRNTFATDANLSSHRNPENILNPTWAAFYDNKNLQRLALATHQ